MDSPCDRQRPRRCSISFGLAQRLKHEVGDLRDAEAVKQSILSVQPDFVFHLGAQAIVRSSFAEPGVSLQYKCVGHYSRPRGFARAQETVRGGSCHHG